MNLNDDMCFAIEFCNPTGGSVGRLTFDKDKVEFVGAADESAKVFIEEVKRQWLAQKP